VFNHFIPDKERGCNDGTQWFFKFPNGYGASVICNPYSYGGARGLYELAVLRNGHICYDTHL